MGSHDLVGRDTTSAGAGILSGPRRQQHLTNHIALPIARTSMRAIARGVPPPVRGRSPDQRIGRCEECSSTIRISVVFRPSLGAARPVRFVQALLADGSLVLVGTLFHVLVADDIRAGMEVMPRRGSMKPAACAPAGAHNCCAPRTGPILADRIKRAGRRACLRLP